MNNQEAIEAIKSNYPTSGYEMLKEALNMAIGALEQQEKERWHTVADGDMPKEYCEDRMSYNFKTVIVQCENGTIGDALWCGTRTNFVKVDLMSRGTFEFKTNKVVSWKELPEEYKPEEKNK